MASNFRVAGLVSGGATCLLSMGGTAEEAIRVARDGAAEEVAECLLDAGQRLLKAYLEEWKQHEDRNGFWKRLRSVGIHSELGLVMPVTREYLKDKECEDVAA
jgi:hypothetical protein